MSWTWATLSIVCASVPHYQTQTAKTVGHCKCGHGPAESWLPCFGSLLFLIVSENEITAIVASLPECPWKSGTVADCPTRDSKKSVAVVLSALA
jgi:hypothetical protein